MEDIKEIERYIEKKWFENHVATVSETDCATILDWSAPGTNKYSVRYIFAGCNLYVSGDIGDAMFNLTWRATIESFDDIELGYLLGKLSCHSRERWHFDEELAIKELNEWYEDATYGVRGDKGEYLQELDSVKANVNGIIQEVSNHKEFELHLFNYYMDNTFDYIDSETFAMFSDFGKKLPNEFVAYLLGIKLAMSQLSEAKKGESIT